MATPTVHGSKRDSKAILVERSSNTIFQQYLFWKVKNCVCFFLVLLDAGAERGVAVVPG